jgi:cytochrome c553
MTSIQPVRTGSARRWNKTAAPELAAVFVLAAVLTAFPSLSPAGVEEGRVKAQVCAACHGVDGNSVNPDIPSIAGQPRQQLVTALFMFREGNRKSEVMAPLAEKLSNADLNDLAAYFNAQKMTAPTRQASADVVARGREVTIRNNCVACHTVTMVGQQHIPRLAGQHKPYLLAQLKAFKARTRGDMDGTMTSAAQDLAEGDLEMLAEYLATLQVP